MIFPTPPPSGPILNGVRRRLRRQPVDEAKEPTKIGTPDEESIERSRRFERTIDLASDDIFIFNMDDQLPIDGKMGSF